MEKPKLKHLKMLVKRRKNKRKRIENLGKNTMKTMGNLVEIHGKF